MGLEQGHLQALWDNCIYFSSIFLRLFNQSELGRNMQKTLQCPERSRTQTGEAAQGQWCC